MVLDTQIKEDLHFLIMEVMGQVRSTAKFLSTFDQTYYQQVAGRPDYIDNLRVSIENNCFSLLLSQPDLAQESVNLARGIHTISTNLKSIASFSLNIVRQVEFLYNRTLWLTFDAQNMVEIIENCLQNIGPAVESGDLGMALDICHCEYEIDRLYLENFKRIMEELRSGQDTESYITILFIFRYLERIGDSLLNIGEAILLSILGERIRIRQFNALKQTLESADMGISLDHLNLSSFWGTRSGCNISKVADDQQSGGEDTAGREALFKTGRLEKIEKEKENLERWERLIPGLVPKVLTFHKTDARNGSLLVEFLQGNNLQEIVLGNYAQLVETVVDKLCSFLRETSWAKTKQNGATETSYMEQVVKRFDSIHQVHKYMRNQKKMGDVAIDSTQTLVKKCMEIERLLPAPFSVFLHGDFNGNNILYNRQENKIHFIDVNRFTQGDYIQDVSVFLVSNFRLPVFEAPVREQVNQVIVRFYEFAREFAKEHNDSTFEVRLTMALARSFYTSTRFQLNSDFVKEMVMRANFLLEKVEHFHREKKDWREFSLPEAVLYL